jgi:hypothetical protein
LSRSKRLTSASFLPNPVLVVIGIQLMWGRLSSGVSSMVTIFMSGLMNIEMQFRSVVFPDATPPATRTELLFSTANQSSAARSGETVLSVIMSTIVSGSALNLLMVNVAPLFEISVP